MWTGACVKHVKIYYAHCTLHIPTINEYNKILWQYFVRLSSVVLLQFTVQYVLGVCVHKI